LYVPLLRYAFRWNAEQQAIYAGEDPPIRAMLQHCVHINASPACGACSQHVVPLSEQMTQEIQNQMLRYRSEHLPEVSKSELNVAGFSRDFNAIASALGECIVDATDLQDELVQLLYPYSERQIAERVDDLGSLAVGAALKLCHEGKEQVLVGEIASEVYLILKDRDERLQFGAEKVGHRLKRAGLLTRRLGAAGNGLLFDRATQILLHNVAGHLRLCWFEQRQRKPPLPVVR
jgi:hypothetical protein